LTGRVQEIEADIQKQNGPRTDLGVAMPCAKTVGEFVWEINGRGPAMNSFYTVAAGFFFWTSSNCFKTKLTLKLRAVPVHFSEI
jgi:hypothetical protein